MHSKSKLTSPVAFLFLATAILTIIQPRIAFAYTVSAQGANGSTYGADGGDAGDIEINLSENSNFLLIQGSAGNSAVNSQISRFGEAIMANASGGDAVSGYPGRNGLPGINGRPGEDGRPGRPGYPGRNGRNGTASSPDGENGQDGGPGENGTSGQRGQDGGNGENGGNGGDGGDAGDGGRIVVKAYSPDFFMHIRADFSAGSRGFAGSAGRGGAAGEGGRGGYAGRGGDGGQGGAGGRGYRCSQQEIANGCRNGRDGDHGRRGRDGYSGSSGSDGFDGTRGRDGQPGQSGTSGYNGSIKLVLLNANGSPIWEHNSLNIYKLQVTRFELSDDNQDGIFEPGENFTVRNIQVRNVGGLTSPVGAEIHFVDGPVNQAPALTVPAIGVDQSYTLPDVVQGQVPANSKPGQSFRIASEIRFRGLTFNAEDYATGFSVRFPLEITKFETYSTIPYETKIIAKVTVTNVSSKTHSMNLTYSQTGKFDISPTMPLIGVGAGASAVEVIEISAAKNLPAYAGTSITAQLHRGNLNYASSSADLQVAPSYQFSDSQSLLLLVDRQTVDDFSLVSATLEKLGFKADIYDLNLNGPLADEVAKNYSGKSSVVFLSGRGKTSAATAATLQKMIDQGSGLFAMAMNPNLASPNYRVPVVNLAQSFFNLKPDEQAATLSARVFDALSNARKRQHIAAMLSSQNSPVLNLVGTAYVREISNEFNLARKDKSIYESADPLIQQYNAWVMELHPLKEIALKTYMSGYSDTFLKFEHSALETAWGKFKDYFNATHEYYLNSLKLAGSCGQITGNYYDSEGTWMSFKKNWLGTIRGWDQGVPFKYKLKKSSELEWTTKYKVEKSEFAGRVKMTCNNGLIQLLVEKPHLGTNTTQVLTKVSVKPLGDIEQDDEDQ